MSEQIIIERDIPCELRDGTTLYANVYRPNQDGEWPALLTRLPYNKNLPNFSHRYIDPIKIALAGYVVIIQDVRGRFSSEGEFHPFQQEFYDGYDSIEWAASLPYSNGHVGMFGLSYYGFTQLFAAMTNPPSLKAIFPAFTGHDIANGFSYRDGAVELGKLQTWLLDSVASDYLKRKQSNTEYEKTEELLLNDLEQIFQWHSYTPYEAWPPAKKHPALYDLYVRYMNNNLMKNEDQFSIENVNIPGLHLAGWYDCFLNQTIDNYAKMHPQNDNQKLIIGPWGHGVFSPFFGERYFGLKASDDQVNGQYDLTSLHIEWFNYWLKGISNDLVDREAPIQLFVMGDNQWRSEYEWPLNRTNYKPLYVTNDGLDFQHPNETFSYSTYDYAPEDPVPTKGGPTLLMHNVNTGPLDQQNIESRDDVLVFTSETLTKPLEITGPVKAYIHASSDAVDTDFTVKLTDVLPNGRSINVTEGIVRATHQHPDFKANHITLFEIDLWATSQVFLQGHAIRIQISSSNFPVYDVNPNTGATLKDTTKTQIAKQTIYHDDKHPSHILLPIIPR
ncbi:CocE/NonD family hydrolase [Alkalibacillus sp. S2W]|uniref:CocE/NonD family hydrolase n=1 Tax=Alkalibacillus sp. S2W TaxID=3386553 RepID=UPI00398D31B6